MTFLLLSIAAIIVVTWVPAIYPFFKKYKTPQSNLIFFKSDNFACGVFLGAGLVHILSDAASSFYNAHIFYPWPFVITGVTILLLFSIEHTYVKSYSSTDDTSPSCHKDHSKDDISTRTTINSEHSTILSLSIPYLGVIFLSIHSFFAGLALGLGQSISLSIILLIAIVTHKWAEAFALSVELVKKLKFRNALIAFAAFSSMTPIGIIIGRFVKYYDHYPTLTGSVLAIAAGTFIYMALGHDLHNNNLVQCHRFPQNMIYILAGFSLMCILAVLI